MVVWVAAWLSTTVKVQVCRTAVLPAASVASALTVCDPIDRLLDGVQVTARVEFCEGRLTVVEYTGAPSSVKPTVTLPGRLSPAVMEKVGRGLVVEPGIGLGSVRVGLVVSGVVSTMKRHVVVAMLPAESATLNTITCQTSGE